MRKYLPAIAMALLVLAGCQHWAAGILALSVWMPWKILRHKALEVPGNWIGWALAFSGLMISTSLTERPSGLQWAGLLQWISIASEMIVIWDLLRSSRKCEETLVWSLLGSGVIRTSWWIFEFADAHRAWWEARSPDLPLFPVRIRLFGSHGSTQTALWIGCLIMLGTIWALPRIRGGRWLAGWIAILSTWALLMGLCDSRLANISLIAATVFFLAIGGRLYPLIWIACIPVAVGLVRDHVHPSRLVTGGGVGASSSMLAAFLILILGTLLVRRKFPVREIISSSSRTFIWVLISIPFGCVGVAGIESFRGLDAFASGRLEFWAEGIRIIERHPILGVGPWGYVWQYSQDHDWTFGFLAMHPHNAVLEILCAGGALLLLGIGVIFRSPLKSINESPRIEPGSWVWPIAVMLSIGSSFDSPLSSPAVQLVLAAMLARMLSPNDVAVLKVPPRSTALAPLLLLVPFAFLIEAQVDKYVLVASGDRIRSGDIDEATRIILSETAPARPDPQWLRNALMARTTRSESNIDSLSVLEPIWDSLVVLEPGFLPNSVHHDWVQWRVHPGDSTRAKFEIGARRLLEGRRPLMMVGDVPEGWKVRYPTDSVEYWSRRLLLALATNKMDEVRWIDLLMRYRGLPMMSSDDRNATIRSWRPTGAEQSLYGSVGTEWFLIPVVAQDANSLFVVGGSSK